MREQIVKALKASEEAVAQLQRPDGVLFIEQVAGAIARAYQGGQKVITAGNGGSCCEAAHFAEELTGFFGSMRPALPAIALSEPGHITCVGNDLGFEEIFARGVEAFGQPGDVFVGLTTSGNSPNMVRAFEVAKERGLITVAFLGKTGGKLRGFANYELIIEGFATSDRIQEAHMVAMHTIIEVVEAHLFSNENASI